MHSRLSYSASKNEKTILLNAGSHTLCQKVETEIRHDAIFMLFSFLSVFSSYKSKMDMYAKLNLLHYEFLVDLSQLR